MDTAVQERVNEDLGAIPTEADEVEAVPAGDPITEEMAARLDAIARQIFHPTNVFVSSFEAVYASMAKATGAGNTIKAPTNARLAELAAQTATYLTEVQLRGQN